MCSLLPSVKPFDSAVHSRAGMSNKGKLTRNPYFNRMVDMFLECLPHRFYRIKNGGLKVLHRIAQVITYSLNVSSLPQIDFPSWWFRPTVYYRRIQKDDVVVAVMPFVYNMTVLLN